MLNTLCKQDKPGKDEKSSFFSDRFHYNKNPECDKKRSTPFVNHRKT